MLAAAPGANGRVIILANASIARCSASRSILIKRVFRASRFETKKIAVRRVLIASLKYDPALIFFHDIIGRPSHRGGAKRDRRSKNHQRGTGKVLSRPFRVRACHVEHFGVVIRIVAKKRIHLAFLYGEGHAAVRGCHLGKFLRCRQIVRVLASRCLISAYKIGLSELSRASARPQAIFAQASLCEIGVSIPSLIAVSTDTGMPPCICT